MGNSNSKTTEKYNKNHVTKKGFQFGLSFGREDLTMEGNIQIGWTNKTIKNYTAVPKSCSANVGTPLTTEINDIDNKIYELDSAQTGTKEG